MPEGVHITGRRDVLLPDCGDAETGQAAGVTPHEARRSRLTRTRRGRKPSSPLAGTRSPSDVFWCLRPLADHSFLNIPGLVGKEEHGRKCHAQQSLCEETLAAAAGASPVPGADDLQAVFQALLGVAERRQLERPAPVGSGRGGRRLLLLLPGYQAAAQAVPAHRGFSSGGGNGR